MTDMKRCSKCEEFKLATEEYFYSRNGKLLAQCKECQKKASLDHYNKNHDEINKVRRQRVARNRDKVNERKRKWNAKNKDKVRESNKRWRKNNPEKYAIYLSTRSRRKQIGGDYCGGDLFELYLSQKGCCWWCEERLYGKFHIDHRIALSRNGKDELSNICLTCALCNTSKGSKLPHEWNGRLI